MFSPRYPSFPLHLTVATFTHYAAQVPISDPHSVQGVPLSDADQASVHDIRHDWKVAHRLSLAMQRPDGSVKRATELVFKKGDFVEVLVYADILAYSKDSKPFVDIQYAPQEVVRLWSAADANVSSILVFPPDVHGFILCRRD